MLDLIFRNRARMAAVYGRVEPGPLAGERFQGPAPKAALPAPLRAGQVGTRGRSLVALPMPRRVRPEQTPRRRNSDA